MSGVKSKRRKLLLWSLCLAGTLLAAALFVRSSGLRRVLEHWVEERASTLVQGEIQIELRALELAAGRAVLDKVAIRRHNVDVTVDTIELDWDWTVLALGGSAIHSLAARGVRGTVRFDGRPSGIRWPPVDEIHSLLPRRLSVGAEGLTFVWPERQIELGEVWAAGQGVLDRHVGMVSGKAALTDDRLGHHSIPFEAIYEADQGGLRIGRLAVAGPAAELVAEVELETLSPLRYVADVAGQVDAETLLQKPLGSFVRGRLEVDGRITADGRATRLDAELVGDVTQLGDWTVEGSRADLTLGTDAPWRIDLRTRLAGSRLRVRLGPEGTESALPLGLEVELATGQFSEFASGAGIGWPWVWNGPLSGHARLRLTSVTPLTLEFLVDSSTLELDPEWPLELTAEGELRGDRWDFASASVAAPGFGAELRGRLDSVERSWLDLDASVEAVESLFPSLKALGFEPPATLEGLRSAAWASASLESEQGGFDGAFLSGSSSVLLSDATHEDLWHEPSAVTAEAELRAGVVRVSSLRAASESVRVRGSLLFDPDGVREVDLDAVTEHPGRLVARWLERRAGERSGSAAPPGLASVVGTTRISLNGSAGWGGVPDLLITVDTDDLESGGAPIGRVNGRLAHSPSATQAVGSLGNDSGGSLEIDYFKDPGGTRFVLEASDLELASLAPVSGIPVAGSLNAQLGARGERLVGTGQLSIDSLRLGPLGLGRLTTDLEVDGTGLGLPCAQLDTPGGLVELSAWVDTVADRIQANFRSNELELGELLGPWGKSAPAISLSLDGELAGPVTRPSTTAFVRASQAARTGASSSPLEGWLLSRADELWLDLETADRNGWLRLDMELAGALPWTADLGYPLQWDLRRLGSSSEARSQLEVSSEVHAELSGFVSSLSALEGFVAFGGFEIASDVDTLVPDSELRLQLGEGSVRLLSNRVAGDTSELELGGSVSLEPPHSVRVGSRGDLDTALLSAFDDRFRSEGRAAFDLGLEGTLAEPGVAGWMKLDGVRIRHRTWPAGLEGLMATLRAEPGEGIELESLHARLGGGRIVAEGDLGLNGLRPGRLEVDLLAKGVRLRYPDDFRFEGDAQLGIDGYPEEHLVLSGLVDLKRGLYDRDISVAEELLAPERLILPRRTLLDEVELDLDVFSRDGLWVRNNLARVECAAVMRVAGSVRYPEVHGRVRALEDGQVTFQNVAYQITDGALEFDGGDVLDPELDVRAATEVSGYDIALEVTGRASEPRFELSSQPRLSETDIVTLLLTGRTSDRLSFGSASQDDVTSYLSLWLAQQAAPLVGRALDLDEIRVDTVLVRGETNPTARVTVGKALGKRLHVTYSSRTATGDNDLYQLRYRLSDAFDLIAARDSDRRARCSEASPGRAAPTSERPSRQTPSRRGGPCARSRSRLRGTRLD